MADFSILNSNENNVFYLKREGKHKELVYEGNNVIASIVLSKKSYNIIKSSCEKVCCATSESKKKVELPPKKEFTMVVEILKFPR